MRTLLPVLLLTCLYGVVPSEAAATGGALCGGVARAFFDGLDCCQLDASHPSYPARSRVCLRLLDLHARSGCEPALSCCIDSEGAFDDPYLAGSCGNSAGTVAGVDACSVDEDTGVWYVDEYVCRSPGDRLAGCEHRLLECQGLIGGENACEEGACVPVPAHECNGDRLIRARGNPLSCCESGNRQWLTLNGTRLAHRVFADACTEADGEGLECSGMACTYGPCEARIAWTVDADEVRIFHPESAPDECGFAFTNLRACNGCDWAVGSSFSWPEPYVGQEDWVGTESTCDLSGCAAGGEPF